jgi:hypothetical protein
MSSYRTRVEHDSYTGAKALGREVVSKFGADDSTVAVRSSDFAPDYTNLAALPFFAGSVDVCDSLSQIEPVDVMSAVIRDSSLRHLRCPARDGTTVRREALSCFRMVSRSKLPHFRHNPRLPSLRMYIVSCAGPCYCPSRQRHLATICKAKGSCSCTCSGADLLCSVRVTDTFDLE